MEPTTQKAPDASAAPPQAAPEIYPLDKPPAKFKVEATDALFARKGSVIGIPALSTVFISVPLVKRNGEVVHNDAQKPEHRVQTLAMTPAVAASLEADGFLVTPSPRASMIADFQKREAEREAAEKTAMSAKAKSAKSDTTQAAQ